MYRVHIVQFVFNILLHVCEHVEVYTCVHVNDTKMS